jgi:hypothetical protein
MTTKQTQLKAVQRALLAREPVNPVEAMNRGWGVRLGAIIYRLRARGWPIDTQQDQQQRHGPLLTPRRLGTAFPAVSATPANAGHEKAPVRDQLTGA